MFLEFADFDENENILIDHEKMTLELHREFNFLQAPIRRILDKESSLVLIKLSNDMMITKKWKKMQLDFP